LRGSGLNSSIPKTAAFRFHEERAFADLERICRQFGPRPSGSPAAEAQRQWAAEWFRSLGGVTSFQEFTSLHPLTEEPVGMANLIGSWWPERRSRLLIGAHADTRPFPDREPDPSRRRDPFLGANDGASGVAAVIECARLLTAWSGVFIEQEGAPEFGVDLVLFDAEEFVFGETGRYCLGSREFARRLVEGPEPAPGYFEAVVVDLIAGPEMTLPLEGFSEEQAPVLSETLWEIARRIGSDRFERRPGPYVEDDHLPLLAVGIPSVALVDLAYPEWHTADDRPERCSAASLGQVGRVLEVWLADRLGIGLHGAWESV